MDKIVSVFSCISTESPVLSNTGKYGLEKARIHYFSRSAQIYVVVVLEMPLYC